MEETIAELRRQVEEQQRLREAAERRVQPNTLFGLLDRCHNTLSQAIQVEADATLTTQGDAAEPVNRLYPKHIVPWLDFPQLQEQVWGKFDRTAAFTSRPLFPSDTQIDYVATNVQNRPIYSEASLRNFERDTVDTFVEKVIQALRDDKSLRQEFGIQGRVTFYDRANPWETSLENSLEQMNLQDPRTPQRPTNIRHGRGRGRGRGVAQSQKRDGTARRRNRRADQFCVHLVADERQVPVYAVEFKAPHKVTIPELVAGLHQMDLARDVIDQEGDTFEFHATRLVAAVVTQIFSYMIDSGVRYGYICTGEAFVFLHIPEDDPTITQYFLCIPNQDVQADDELRLHRTAIGQVLAFTLQALAVEPPTQEWHDTAHKQLTTWEVEYLDVLREIPETLRKDPRASNYRPSHWKPERKRDRKIHNTRSRARCQPGASTPKHSSTEGSGSEEESHSPSTAAASRSRSSHGRGNSRKSTRGSERTRAGRDNKQTSPEDGKATRPYCTIACIRGIVNRDPLDKKCPNWKLHGTHRHSMGPQELTRQLHRQLVRDRDLGFEQLHVCGRTGYLMKATLLSRGYTVIIKATTVEKQHRLQTEVDNYHHLRNLQGQHIPVCLGDFKPRVAYWYHGELMAQMVILSWSGTRLQHVINDGNSSFFHHEREKALAVLRSRGVIHGDSEWRNMLWDDLGGHLFVIDLEDVKWLKRARAPLEPTPGNNTRRNHHGGARENKHSLTRVEICDMAVP
ncbi:metalloprotease m41 ftsh [Aspergillus sclerotiicarbonarius CBS 121057]|uniref:Metalloprotease m41 ftsh n=1 Tax=Aspergillus sclerotiicarbonarius (strain CBS 121057 / IBT 28362) TaxID=1448318 RepID=A0A319E7S3_ASPSB|nr:metalloprotease m41 ftsh [Aspergillus sclerotiicarbonarius CBS 121057]